MAAFTTLAASQRLTLHGQRGGLELDFYCLACAETVTIPFLRPVRIPVGESV